MPYRYLSAITGESQTLSDRQNARQKSFSQTEISEILDENLVQCCRKTLHFFLG